MTTLASLIRPAPVLAPTATIADAADRFLEAASNPFLSLPVIDGQQPVGIVTRHEIQRIYLSRFGRELHARKTVAEIMITRPIIIRLDMAVEVASRHVVDRVGFPIREDFLLVNDNGYQGVGVVVDLLRLMEQHIARRNTELGKALHQLKESQQQLVQSEKMASLGQMVAGVAHELNTPLGYVRNNVEMLQGMSETLRTLLFANLQLLAALDNPEAEPDAIAVAIAHARETIDVDAAGMLTDDLGSLLDDTLHGCTQIGELVNSLKDFSRLDRAASENIDINDCINSALLIARHVTRDRIEVIRDLGELPPVVCIPSQINQVILNLVTNAAQAVEGNGRVLVRTRLENQDVHIVVQDNGKGIAAEHIKRIFDPFFTTKPVGQGTGLGLSICYRIINEHGGRIRVASTPGKGTRFTVILPTGAASVETTTQPLPRQLAEIDVTGS